MNPRLLVNENFPAPSVAWLRHLGYDVYFVTEPGKGLTDREVLAIAVSEQRWVLTFDRDYVFPTRVGMNRSTTSSW